MGGNSVEDWVKGPIVIFGDYTHFETGGGTASIKRLNNLGGKGSNDLLLDCAYREVDFGYNRFKEEGREGIWFNNMGGLRKELPAPITKEGLRDLVYAYGGTCLIGFMADGNVVYDRGSHEFVNIVDSNSFAVEDKRQIMQMGDYDAPRMIMYPRIGLPDVKNSPLYRQGQVISVFQRDSFMPVWVDPQFHKG